MCVLLISEFKWDENNIVPNPNHRRIPGIYIVYHTIYVMNWLVLLNERIGCFTFWVLYHESHQHCSEKTPFWFVIFDFWVPTFSVQVWDDRLGPFFLLLAKGIKRIELQLGRYSKVSGFKSAWINKITNKFYSPMRKQMQKWMNSMG